MNPIENDHEIESLELQFPAAAGLAFFQCSQSGPSKIIAGRSVEFCVLSNRRSFTECCTDCIG